MLRILSCDQCDYKTDNRTCLSSHLLTLHSDTKFTCHECGYQTSWKSSLTLHKQSLHEGKKYHCGSCDYQATQRGNPKKHQQSVHEGKKYPCDSCDYQATQRGDMKRHVLDEEAEILKCDKCDFDTEEAYWFRQHIIKEHSINIFHGLDIQTNKALQPPQTDTTENERTKEIQESEQTPNIPCSKCESKLKTMEDLENHIIVHDEQSSVKCDYCSYVSNSEQDLIQHKETTHQQTATQNG